jgi:hypothetical protein
VASWRKFCFPVWAAWFVCLPSTLQAFPGDGSQVYTIALPASTAPTKIEFEVSYLGGWEVTVAFDPEHCQLHCTYRKTRQEALLKPITSIRIYAGPAAKPTTLIVNPAGLGLPAAAGLTAIRAEEFGLPGRWWPVALLFPEHEARAPAAVRAGPIASTTLWSAPHSAALPLRI